MSVLAPGKRNLCLSVAGPSMAEALAALANAKGRADMVELRLDLIQGYDLERLLRARPCPFIVTLRPERQGGAYGGDEAWRVAELRRAARLGAEWIDVELDATDDLGPLPGARRIVSFHDFLSPPDQPAQVMASLWAAGADAAKLAVVVQRPGQLAPLLQLLADAPGPSIVLGMGSAGVASRVLCLRYDRCLLTYVAPHAGAGTAPGQITLQDMDEVYRARAIGQQTRAIGYLGPAEDRQALRAANAELSRGGLEAVCVPLGGADAEGTLEAVALLGLDGCLVPPALEAPVARVVPLLTPQARRRRRVNVLLRRQEGLLGAWGPDLPAQIRLLDLRSANQND